MRIPASKIIDYTQLIKRVTGEFVGRQWVNDAVERFLQDPGPIHFLLLGEPGCGKTAFLADLVRRKRYPHHFVGRGSMLDMPDSPQRRSPLRLAESIGYQLVRDYGSWVMAWDDWGISVNQRVKELQGLLVGAEIGDFNALPRQAAHPILSVAQEVEQFGPAAHAIGVYIERFQLNVTEVITQLLLKPLTKVAERWPHRPVVVVIDGLDEAGEYGDEGIVEMLPTGDLPTNVRFVLSSRPGTHITPVLTSHARICWLSEDEQGRRDQRTDDDARTYIARLAVEPQVQTALRTANIDRNKWIDALCDASNGNFLYLYHYAQELRADGPSFLSINDAPPGLNGIYSYFLRSLRSNASGLNWILLCKPLLGALAVAREPLSQRQLSLIIGTDRETVSSFLLVARNFIEVLSGAERRYLLYHHSFGEFLVSEDNEDFIDAFAAHSRFAEHILQSWGGLEDGLSKLTEDSRGEPNYVYGLRYLPAHLSGAGRYDSVVDLLLALPFLETKAEAGLMVQLAGDFDVALGTIPTTHSRWRHLKLLREAIGRDLNFLVRHRSSLFQSLWNLCWWYDCDDASAHYGSASTSLANFELQPRLSALLEKWRGQKRERSPGFFWIRSRRPPTVRLGSPQTHELRAHTQAVDAVAFSNDGTRLATGSADGSIRLWSLKSGEQIGVTRYDDPKFLDTRLDSRGERLPWSRGFYGVHFSPDDSLFVASTSIGALLCDSRTCAAVTRLPDSDGRRVAFTNDGKRLVTLEGTMGGEKGTMGGQFPELYKCWDVSTSVEVQRNEVAMMLTSLCVNRPGHHTFLVSQGGLEIALVDYSGETMYDWRVDVFSVSGNHLLTSLPGEFSVACFSFCGGMVAIHSRESGSLVIYSTRTGERIVTLANRNTSWWFASVTFSYDGAQLVAACSDCHVRVWNVRTGREVNCFRGHQDVINEVAFSRDGIFAASASRDASARVWDTRPGPSTLTMSDHLNDVASVCFSKTGDRVLSGSADAVIEWQTETGLIRRRFDAGVEALLDLAYSRDGERVVSVGPRTVGVSIWDTRSGSRLTHISDEGAYTADLSPDHSRIVTADFGAEFTVRMRESDSGRQVAVLPCPATVKYVEHPIVAFTDDGAWIFAFIDHDILAWSAETCQLVDATKVPQLPSRIADHCAYTNDRSGLIVTDFYNTGAYVRDRSTGQYSDEYGQELSAPPPKLQSGCTLSVNSFETTLTWPEGVRPMLSYPVAVSFTATDRELGTGPAMVMVRPSPADDVWAGAVGRHLFILSVEQG